MAGLPPGPICSSRVGDDWIDLGTACRALVGKPGVADFAAAAASVVLGRVSPFKKKFDTDHVYSMSVVAARKRNLDLLFLKDDYSKGATVSLDNEAYLKELVNLASGGKITVSAGAKRMQFFYLQGGGEGFLPASMFKSDASKIVLPGSTTRGVGVFAYEFTFESNDLLIVFSKAGKLIKAARLERPLSILDKTISPDSPANPFRASTSDSIFKSWDKQDVVIYRNTNFGVPYLGLHVLAGAWIVDFHKQEDTNGCIFIVDPTTPPNGSAALDTFEPQLINDILKEIGKVPADVKGAVNLGVMRMVPI